MNVSEGEQKIAAIIKGMNEDELNKLKE